MSDFPRKISSKSNVLQRSKLRHVHSAVGWFSWLCGYSIIGSGSGFTV